MTYWDYFALTAAMFGGTIGLVVVITLIVKYLPAKYAIAALALALLFLFPLLMQWGQGR